MGEKLSSPIVLTADEMQIAEVLISMPPETNDVMISMALAYGFREPNGAWRTIKMERVYFTLRHSDPATGQIIEDADMRALVDQHYDTIKQALYDLLKKKGVIS